MSQQQRALVEAQLRASQEGVDADLSVEQRRHWFEALIARRPKDDDVSELPASLGGRPAVEVTVRGAEGSAVLLYLHGGGYVLGSARTGVRLAAALVRRIGGRAVSLDYRLAPEHPHPAAVEDALAAYRDLLAAGTPPGRIVVAGDSAGGGLAVALLLAARRAGLPQPAAAVVLSPWVDLTLRGASMTAREDVDPIFTREAMQWYADTYLAADDDPCAESASPAFADLSGLAPLLVQVGTHEVLLDDALRLADRAADAELDVALEVYAAMPHVFQNFAGVLDEASAALDSAGAFVRSRLV